MLFKLNKKFITASLIFVILLGISFQLAQRKLLWIDELFTQHKTIDTHSYFDILTLNFPEGNKSPLFYIAQKTFCDLTSHKLNLPPTPMEKLHRISEPKSQLLIRIPSAIYMSLGLALIFYFFYRYFSLFWGIYALTASLVTPMVWMYWVEARPYSLWFLLTTIQLILTYKLILFDHSHPRSLIKKITLTHILLSLTSVASVFQISIISLLLWRKRILKKELWWVFVLPIGINLFYYFSVPMFTIQTHHLWYNFFEVIMPERLLIYVVYGSIFIFLNQRKSPINSFFLKTFLLFLISGLYLLISHMYVAHGQFGFSTRYLIYLVPVDIIMLSLASHDIVYWTKKNIFVSINVFIVLIGLLLLRALLTYSNLIAAGTYLHSPG